MSTRLELLKASNHYFTAKALPAIHPPNNYNNIFTANKFNFQINTRLRFDYEYMVQFIGYRWSHDFEICWIFPTVFPRWMSFREIFFRNTWKKNCWKLEISLILWNCCKFLNQLNPWTKESFNWFWVFHHLKYTAKTSSSLNKQFNKNMCSIADSLNSTGSNVTSLSESP